MQISARNGCLPILMLLFKNGASVNSRGLNEDTLFHLASYNGHVHVLKWLHSVGKYNIFVSYPFIIV